jgi:hypothetical protein
MRHTRGSNATDAGHELRTGHRTDEDKNFKRGRANDSDRSLQANGRDAPGELTASHLARNGEGPSSVRKLERGWSGGVYKVSR